MGMKNPRAHGNGDRNHTAVAREEENEQQRRDDKKREHEREERRVDGASTGSAKPRNSSVEQQQGHRA